MDNQFLDRVKLQGTLDEYIREIALVYDLGEVKNANIIPIGFEDLNVRIESGKGVFLAKMFASSRSGEDIDRYVGIVEHALDAGVRHPQLIHTKEGERVFCGSGSSPLVLLEYISGSTYSQLKQSPGDGELSDLLGQLARLHGSDYVPQYLSDSWAVQNIFKAYERVECFLSKEELALLSPILEAFKSAPLEELPRTFVHGDCTKSNVLQGDDGKIYVLDFSVANCYPRIQDLAVVAANLLHYDGDLLRGRVNRVMDVYLKHGTLTDLEKELLYMYSRGAVAMELLGSLQERHLNGNQSEEVEYWYQLGLEGLRGS